QLVEVRDQADDPKERLEAVLTAYAELRHKAHGHGGTDVAVRIHRDDHVAHAEDHLRHMFRALITDAARSGNIRDDVPADELASYCLNALASASDLSSK